MVYWPETGSSGQFASASPGPHRSTPVQFLVAHLLYLRVVCKSDADPQLPPCPVPPEPAADLCIGERLGVQACGYLRLMTESAVILGAANQVVRSQFNELVWFLAVVVPSGLSPDGTSPCPRVARFYHPMWIRTPKVNK